MRVHSWCWGGLVAAMGALPLVAAKADDGGNFFSRFVSNYQDHMNFTGDGLAPTPYRGSEPPLDSPPTRWPTPAPRGPPPSSPPSC